MYTIIQLLQSPEAMRKITIIFLITLFFSSCQNTVKEKTVPIDNKYSLTIPSFLNKSNTLNEDASLQYEHRMKELYVIVVDDLISDLDKAIDENDLSNHYSKDIHGYTNLSLDGFELEISVLEKSEPLFTTINNLPAYLTTIKANVNNFDAFYSLAFIEGENRYYQIMTWTLAAKESEHKDKMQRMIYSFKEL